MIRCVVDTNVAVVANGRDTNASIDCRLASIAFLKKLIARGRTTLDLGGEIQAEYRRHLNPSGQPGVGDLFYQMILSGALAQVERVELRRDEASGEFCDFPSDPALNGFDESDRKFVAAACAAGVPVANAVDSDWLDYKQPLRANGVVVDFVCGCDVTKWHAN